MSVENFPEPWQKKLADLATAYGIEIEELTVTENGTYSEEGKAYSPVKVNVSGGGSSDYSIASVVFTNNATDDFAIAIPWIFEGSMNSFIDYEDIDGETPFDIVLYKGEAMGTIMYSDVDAHTQIVFSESTGDTEIAYNSIYINGDGTATIADESE